MRFEFNLPVDSDQWQRGSMTVRVAFDRGGRRRRAVVGTEITVSRGDVVQVDDPTAARALAQMTDDQGRPLVSRVADAGAVRQRWDDKFDAAPDAEAVVRPRIGVRR